MAAKLVARMHHGVTISPWQRQPAAYPGDDRKKIRKEAAKKKKISAASK